MQDSRSDFKAIASWSNESRYIYIFCTWTEAIDVRGVEYSSNLKGFAESLIALNEATKQILRLLV